MAKVISAKPIRIGIAGWNIPPHLKDQFPEEGTHLERYARRFNCVEINTAFYRDHKPETYAKWAESTPADFQFAVKLNRSFLQEKRLEETGPRLQETLDGIAELKEKFGVLLVQLPPSLDFKEKIAERFMSDLRRHFTGPIVWEPRHKTWSSIKAIELFTKYEMSKVLADPEPCPLSQRRRPLVEMQTRYYRLHGTPEIYKSKYSEDMIQRLTAKIKGPLSPSENTWVIFDNTTFGFATENAMELQNSLQADAILNKRPQN